VRDWPRRSWLEAEPEIVEREKLAMTEQAPDMQWQEDLWWRGERRVGWVGEPPVWPAARSRPRGLSELLAGRRLKLAVFYPEAFPMVPPELLPIEPEVPIVRRTLQKWHVMGDGTLCLIQEADDWQPESSAAELVVKAAGWFIEYLLVEAEDLDEMSERGILSDPDMDEYVVRHAP